MSPSDIVGPSPVTSNGTETTEIEDDVSEDIEKEVSDRKATRRSEKSTNKPRLRVTTKTMNQKPCRYHSNKTRSRLYEQLLLSAGRCATVCLSSVQSIVTALLAKMAFLMLTKKHGGHAGNFVSGSTTAEMRT
ncbi:hypothetical protein LB505_000528 [Fusarium chuoi]|nr:hypothetical protein LB505_000528 [Fusarium chuoi]